MKPNNHIFINLKKDVFQKVALRIKHNADSLRNIKRFPRTGIEGWFKVEIVAALGKTIRSINNKGPDITLEDGSDPKKLAYKLEDDMEIVAFKVISDCVNDWLIGIVRPK